MFAPPPTLIPSLPIPLHNDADSFTCSLFQRRRSRKLPRQHIQPRRLEFQCECLLLEYSRYDEYDHNQWSYSGEIQ
jgi:hypothetical protein